MKYETGEFGPIYPQFKGKAKEAIKWLRKQKQGECPMSLYRSGVGYIDIVWGENDPKTNIGYGLKHIIEKHEESIKLYGYEVEDFIPIIVEYGDMDLSSIEKDKIVFKNETFKFVFKTKWNGRNKTFLLTAFDILKKPVRNRQA